jgi:hypothetical protein
MAAIAPPSGRSSTSRFQTAFETLPKSRQPRPLNPFGTNTQLLKVPGVISFMAYRTADGSSPNTITMLEFRTVEEARQEATSNEIKPVLDGLRSVGAAPKVLVVERSPFTPAPEGSVPRLVRGWLPENDADRVQPANSRIFLNGIVLDAVMGLPPG